MLRIYIKSPKEIYEFYYVNLSLWQFDSYPFPSINTI